MSDGSNGHIPPTPPPFEQRRVEGLETRIVNFGRELQALRTICERVERSGMRKGELIAELLDGQKEMRKLLAAIAMKVGVEP